MRLRRVGGQSRFRKRRRSESSGCVDLQGRFAPRPQYLRSRSSVPSCSSDASAVSIDAAAPRHPFASAPHRRRGVRQRGQRQPGQVSERYAAIGSSSITVSIRPSARADRARRSIPTASPVRCRSDAHTPPLSCDGGRHSRCIGAGAGTVASGHGRQRDRQIRSGELDLAAALVGDGRGAADDIDRSDRQLVDNRRPVRPPELCSVLPSRAASSRNRSTS